MKKCILFLSFLLAASLMAGCVPSESRTQSPEQPTGRQEEESPAQTEAGVFFRAGTWLVAGKDSAAYYFFDSDGATGRTASLDTGTGIGFSYSVEDGEAVFYLGSPDTVRKGALTQTNGTEMTIVWEDGVEETMTFISEQGSDEFSFYSNEQLCEMALAYYARETGDASDIQAAAGNEPETVTIQLYRNLGDHNSTCAWYQINRRTGKGIDANSGGEVDLSVAVQSGEAADR